MITKYWRISLSKNGVRVTLSTVTTDAMVDQDLSNEPSKSLIQMARQYHRHPQTEEQDHRDLAIGAIMTHATEPPYDRTDTHIARTDSLPTGDPVNYVGGDRNVPLVPIWEETDEVFE